MILLQNPTDLATRLDAVLGDARLKGAIVAATVLDPDGHTVYARNGDLRVMPASNQKLLSCAFALHTLGPDYRPKTRFWRVGDAIHIESPGDPTLTFPTLRDAARRLGAGRWTSVDLVQAYAPGVPDGWEYDDLPNRYAAAVTAFSVDRGGFELWNDGGRPRFRPASFGVRVSRRTEKGWIYDPIRRTLVIGPLPRETGRLDTLSQPDPDLSALSLFGRLRRRDAPTPDGPETVAVLGHSVGEMLGECLPPSDNLLAENLGLMAATRGRPTPNPYAAYRAQIREFLTGTVGVPAGSVVPYDGSGLSRHNLVTTDALATLLAWSDRRPTRDLWRASLAQAGQGTLKGRMEGLVFQGKTGTVDNVVALSGYVRGSDGRDRVVSFVVNHANAPSSAVRGILDDAVRTVAR